eukprot:COSAG06_NODE_5935_length_3200_cov_10.149952_4_plen_131_part_00
MSKWLQKRGAFFSHDNRNHRRRRAEFDPLRHRYRRFALPARLTLRRSLLLRRPRPDPLLLGGVRVGGGGGVDRCSGNQPSSLFSVVFLYDCPEPVLAKDRLSNRKRAISKQNTWALSRFSFPCARVPLWM